MTVFNEIVAGKVVNRGIKDNSIPEYAITTEPFPLHAPVIHGIFPRGELASVKGTQWISLADFNQIFGNIADYKSPYFGPTSLLLQVLGLGGQAKIGVRRVSANEEISRVALSAYVQQVEVIDYERDLAGQFKRDENGEKIPTGVKYPNGIQVVIRPDDQAGVLGYGKLQHRVIAGTPANGQTPAVPDTLVYPLFELPAGVGDDYNRGGIQAGVSNNALNWRSVAAFVKATGVFPFELKMFTDSTSGVRTFSKTVSRRETATLTLFQTEADGNRYSVKHAVGEFTNTNANRKVTPTPQPFKDALVYQDSIDTLCQLLYVTEKEHNSTLVEVGNMPWQQMNPFTATNHNGAPYYAVKTDDVTLWDLSGSVKAQYGISPFLDKDGKLPEGTTEPTVNDPFNLLADLKLPISPSQSWEINNKLMAADLEVYVNGTEMKNYTRNRQSVFWDVGYSKEVKDVAERLLGARKDIYLFSDATIYDPTGGANELQLIYSRLSSIVASLRLTPESELWGTPTLRATVNLIEAKLSGEATGNFFSGNLDLAYMFARFAGNAQGVIVPTNSPDHADNRLLTLMHSPNIEFEDDEIGADNFSNGAISLRPYDTERLFRPALLSVYTNPDSVLKDVVTGFLCVCAEKIMQDEWNVVCGDTTISAANYQALVKDGGERKLRDRLGGLMKNITVDTTYTAGVVGTRAVMNCVVNGYFNKGKYMMNLDLYAYNEQDAASA